MPPGLSKQSSSLGPSYSTVQLLLLNSCYSFAPIYLHCTYWILSHLITFIYTRHEVNKPFSLGLGHGTQQAEHPSPSHWLGMWICDLLWGGSKHNIWHNIVPPRPPIFCLYHERAIPDTEAAPVAWVLEWKIHGDELKPATLDSTQPTTTTSSHATRVNHWDLGAKTD